VLVAGDGADNIGKQCGGWTITWQGDGNSNSDFPGATSIFEGIRRRVEAAGGKATLAVDGAVAESVDVAVVVFGENPYAEFSGDLQDSVYDHPQDLAILQRLHSAGIRVVSVFLSGRPLWVNPYLNLSDAFVAAWLPGTEGDGVADVLFGSHDFRGKLSFPWQTLFPIGYGLTNASRVNLAPLPVDSPRPASASGWIIEEGLHEIAIRPPEPVDLSREANGGLALQVSMLAKTPISKPLMIFIGSTAMDIAPLVSNGSVRIPLRCFGDVSHVDAFRISTEGELPISVDGVRLVAPAEPLPCPGH